jgi:Flp pilus assembly pilin Flp
MKTLAYAFMNDEAGFIVSAELVLVATLMVIGLIVGMSEVQYAIVSELNDVAEAIGSLNQSFSFTGFAAFKKHGEVKSRTVGSAFRDFRDECDGNNCDLGCDPPVAEGAKFAHHRR